MAKYEKLALEQFEELAHKHGFLVRRGQGADNRVTPWPDTPNVHFQLGDLRIDTKERYLVVEVDSGGDVALGNLVKYWFFLQKRLVLKPVVLIHAIQRTGSINNYKSHYALWTLLRDQMQSSLGEWFQARGPFFYEDVSDLKLALDEFEQLLRVSNPESSTHEGA